MDLCILGSIKSTLSQVNNLDTRLDLLDISEMPSFEYRPYEKGQELLDTRHWQFLLSSNTQADGKTGGFFFLTFSSDFCISSCQ